MIITLIGHERNIGILTLTDYLLDKLGKNNCIVLGWNYLISEDNLKLMQDKIDQALEINKNVIIKYIVPRNNFSIQDSTIYYPQLIDKKSDVIFRVPTYREEISPSVPKIFYKGESNPLQEHINAFYSDS